MAISRRIDAEKPVGYYAFVDVSEPLSLISERSRYTLQLDCVRADSFDQSSLRPLKDEKPYSLVRIVTTAKKLGKMTERETLPKEGDWLFIKLDPTISGPWAWRLQLSNNDYETKYDTRLSEIRFLNDEPGPESVGAKAVRPQPSRSQMEEIHNLTQHDPAKRTDIEKLLRRISKGNEITVYDVGQASCSSIGNDRHLTGFFDVGWPLNFNARTIPPNTRHPNFTVSLFTLKRMVVILSHWDWDHYYYGRRNSNFHKMQWIAPAQIVGPGALKFANVLLRAGRLHLIRNIRSSIPINHLSLFKGNGPPANLNDSGLALLCRRKGGSIFLTGDADYAQITLPARTRLNGVVIPHHGGPMNTQPPNPRTRNISRAIVSYGNGNWYRHPDQAVMTAHQNAGWVNLPTAAHGGARGTPGALSE